MVVCSSIVVAAITGLAANQASAGSPTSVTNLSVAVASTAVSATTDWTIGFTTSSTGALPYPGSSVTLVLPAGTTFGSFDGGSVTDTTTGNSLGGDCENTSGTTVTCNLNGGNTASAGDVLAVALEDVTNPTATGSANTTVSTSADTKTVTKAVTFTAAQAPSHLSVAVASTAVSATTDWTIGFTTSSTGALPYPGSSVTLVLPAGTTFGSFDGGSVTDTTTGNSLGGDCENTSGTTVTCNLNGGNTASAGDVLAVALEDVTNPTATGSANTTVSTSADTKTVTKAVTFTSTQHVSNVSVVPASTAVSATTDWTIGFTTSSTGALPYPGSSVTLVLPAGTTFGSFDGGSVTDTTTGNSLGGDCENTSGTTVTCNLNGGNTASAGDVLAVALEDVTNPTATGSANTTVSTSADTLPASAAFTVTAAKAVSGLSVTTGSTAANATTNWTIGFTTSSTGALPYPGSVVTLKLATGTTFGSFDGGSVTDTTTGNSLGGDCENTSGTTVTCFLNGGNTASAGDVLAVALEDVTNPATTGSASTTVTTSADTVSDATSFTVTPAQAVSSLSVAPASTAAGAVTNWTVGFIASSTGGLDYPGATVKVKLPTGATFNSFEGGTVTDTTTASGLGADCENTSGTMVTCFLNEGNTASAGDVLSVVLNHVTNPTAAGTANTTVTTATDTVPATQSVTIGGAQGPVCAKVKGKISGSVTLSKCTPTKATYASAKGLASALTSGGTFTWATSKKTTVVSDTVSSPGQGSCAAGSIERDISGSVTGGNAKKYAKIGDAVLARLCQNSSGALALVPGTKATF